MQIFKHKGRKSSGSVAENASTERDCDGVFLSVLVRRTGDAARPTSPGAHLGLSLYNLF